MPGVPVIPGPGSGLMTGTRLRDPVPGIRDSVPPTTPGKPGAMTTPGAPGFYRSYQVIWSHRVIRSDQFSLVRKLKRKRLTSVWTGLSFLFLIHRVDRCN